VWLRIVFQTTAARDQQLAAAFRGKEAVDAGVTEDDALELVLSLLSPPRLMELAVEAVDLYIWDRAGSDN